MKRFSIRAIGTTALAAMVLTGGAHRAQADAKDALGVIIGICALTGGCGATPPRTNPPRTPRVSAEELQRREEARRQARDVQSSLNAFGWNVGAVDGSIGRNTRRGISQFQAYMGWTPSGTLSDYEREMLTGAWQMYKNGLGGQYPHTLQAEGPRGLIKARLNPSIEDQYRPRVIEPIEVVENVKAGGGQVIVPLAPAGASMNSRCEIVNLRTDAALGPISAANITDANQALGEKFCDAHSFSIAKSNGRIAGATVPETQLTASCTAITEAAKPVFGSLTAERPTAITDRMRAVNATLGLSGANAQAYGEICVGLGYRTDNADMALAGALVLSAAGSTPYAELVGHHLREGFAVEASTEAAKAWYQSAMAALEQGQPAAFDPSSTLERVAVIRGALHLRHETAGVTPGVEANTLFPSLD